MIKKITFMRFALSFVIAICFGFLSASSMRVYAFESEENFYPLNSPKIGVIQFRNKNNEIIYSGSPTLSAGNKYYLNNNDLIDVSIMEIWDLTDAQFTFPYNSDSYDYYFLGTLVSSSSSVSMSTFKPTSIYPLYYDVDSASTRIYNCYDLNIYDIDSFNIRGFGFSEKVDFEAANNTGLLGLNMLGDKDGYGNKPAGLILELGILAIPIGTDEATISQQILDKLSEMESSITGSIDANTSAINSIGESIVNKLSSVFEELTSNLSSWFSEVKDNLDSNFSALLDQNSEEHEELINGYQGTGTSDASDKFDQSAAELESVEADLTNITNSSIGSYTDTAFDTTVITSLGSSLVYVVTWFTNFWNMGGLFTSILNVGLALSVAFFILRLRGAD